jgi:hypothetical protein
MVSISQFESALFYLNSDCVPPPKAPILQATFGQQGPEKQQGTKYDNAAAQN